jgi:CRP/FNR family transcriptional regulator, cyclic AMP receptor protein
MEEAADYNLWSVRKATIKEQFSEEEIKALYAHSTRFRKGKGEAIWIEEDETPKVYIVDEGYIRICLMNDDGKRLILSFMGPGEFFGAISPDMATMENEEYLEVVRNARLIAIEAKVFHDTLKKHPDMAINILKILENRKRMLEKRITSLLFKDVSARTAELLLEFSTRFGKECPYAASVTRDIPLTHQEIADLVGATRPVVSSVISDLMKADMIHKHDRVLCLNDLEGLKRIADQGIKAFSRASSN